MNIRQVKDGVKMTTAGIMGRNLSKLDSARALWWKQRGPMRGNATWSGKLSIHVLPDAWPWESNFIVLSASVQIVELIVTMLNISISWEFVWKMKYNLWKSSENILNWFYNQVSTGITVVVWHTDNLWSHSIRNFLVVAKTSQVHCFRQESLCEWNKRLKMIGRVAKFSSKQSLSTESFSLKSGLKHQAVNNTIIIIWAYTVCQAPH